MQNTKQAIKTSRPKSIGHNVDLSIGVLIAETTTGEYEVVSPISTINEGIEMAAHDLANRRKEQQRGGDPMHVDLYKLWARNDEGKYIVVWTIYEGLTQVADSDPVS